METSRVFELEHRYGPRVHVLADPWICQILTRICAAHTKPPMLFGLVESVYSALLHRVAAHEFPAAAIASDTRMKQHTQAGTWKGTAIDPRTRVVVANVLRGGNQASLTCFEQLTAALDPDAVRLDYLYFARRTDATGHVSGVDSAGSKLGGSIEGAIVLIPDPMGATGSTVLEVVRAYRRAGLGEPRAILAMHLIITPEYVRQVLTGDDRVRVYAGRVDRGLSSDDVLETVPGTHLERERGLDDHDYIVPGAGGLGEVLNNSFV